VKGCAFFFAMVRAADSTAAMIRPKPIAKSPGLTTLATELRGGKTMKS
jgi:hypothetical protein